ncbi:MAG: hypothetical protein ACUVTE_03840 [Candidatus Bathycorpusculaceae bacterium]
MDTFSGEMKITVKACLKLLRSENGTLANGTSKTLELARRYCQKNKKGENNGKTLS